MYHVYRVGMGTVDVHWKWNNGPNGLHWPVWLILPVFPYPVRHPTSPLGREKINPANAASHQLTHLANGKMMLTVTPTLSNGIQLCLPVTPDSLAHSLFDCRRRYPFRRYNNERTNCISVTVLVCG